MVSPPGAEVDRTDSERPDCVDELVGESQLWRQVIRLPQVGSTNDIAKDLASRGRPEGTVVVAEHQTAGRGRMDRRWLAPPGTCILCSLLFRPDLLPQQAQRLTMLCSLAAADAVEQVAELCVAVKWPNDLIVTSDRGCGSDHRWLKLAGVLTETGMTGTQLDYVVVGIGINVNVPAAVLPDLDPNATSILAETGRCVDRSRLLAALLESVEARYRQLARGQNPQGEWSARLATLGRRIQVNTADGILDGVAEGVDENGALLLRTADGTLRRLFTGDITRAQR